MTLDALIQNIDSDRIQVKYLHKKRIKHSAKSLQGEKVNKGTRVATAESEMHISRIQVSF